MTSFYSTTSGPPTAVSAGYGYGTGSEFGAYGRPERTTTVRSGGVTTGYATKCGAGTGTRSSTMGPTRRVTPLSPAGASLVGFRQARKIEWKSPLTRTSDAMA